MPRTRRVTSPDVPEPPEGSFSNLLVVDGVAYMAGLTSRGPSGEVEGADEFEQSTVVFRKIRVLLEAAGGGMADVVKLTVFVTDIGRSKEVWRARGRLFSGDFPASTLVQVAALAHPAMRVEIEAVAHLGAGTGGEPGGTETRHGR